MICIKKQLKLKNFCEEYDIPRTTVLHSYRNTGKQVQHFVLSFDKQDNQICTYDIYEIGYRICALFPEYQSIFGFYQNTDNPHIHFAISPVRIHDGKKLNFTYEETFTLRKHIAEILEPYSIRCNLVMD